MRPELISVIIPVRNGEAHIAEQLRALARQTYDGPWELVVADNGSTDGTLDVVRRYAGLLPAVRVVAANRTIGPNYARNVGAAAARGDFLAYCDCDDVATPRWLEGLARAAEDAEIVGGRLDFAALNPPRIQAWRPQEPMTELVMEPGWLPCPPGGNLGVWRWVAREIGWDESFRSGSCDQGLAWRAQLAGYRLTFAPEAVMQQRYRSTMGATARQWYGYGRSGPALYRTFRGQGIPPADNRAALQQWGRLFRDVPGLCNSRDRRGNWIRRAAFRFGRLVGSAGARVLVL